MFILRFYLLFLLLKNHSFQNNANYKLINGLLYIKDYGRFNLSKPLNLTGIKFNSQKHSIIDNSLILDGLQVEAANSQLSLFFENFNGFDIKSNPLSKIKLKNIKFESAFLNIKYSSLNFYFGQIKLNENCDSSLFIRNNFSNRYFLFTTVTASFEDSSYPEKICPLAFYRSHCRILRLSILSNSLINKNKFEFLNLTNSFDLN